MSDVHDHDPACEVAHGNEPDGPNGDRTLVAVYATPMASCLLRWGQELGFRPVLLEPDDGDRGSRDAPFEFPSSTQSVTDPALVPIDAMTDVVVTDHHRDDLGEVMAPLVRARPRWIGILGAARHTGPHVAALRGEGVDDELIATVRRPIGVDIGSKTPPEIALSVLAGLLADRNGRGGALPALPSVPAAPGSSPASA